MNSSEGHSSSDPSEPPPTEEDTPAQLRKRVRNLEYEVARLKMVLRQARDMIVTTDLDGRVTNFNEEAESILGSKAAEVVGQPAEVFYVHKRTRRRLLESLEASEEGVVRADVQVRTKRGKKRWLGLTLSWLTDPTGKRIGTVGVSKEITARRALEAKLRRLSITDKLTGLFNQSHFFQRLEIEKERSVRLGHELALLLFDLDGFKKLNDTFGHRIGDTVLHRIGGILFKNVRKGVDSAFRYGGDEFTVLLPGADAETAVTFAERVGDLIRTLEVDGQSAALGASMGVVCFDRSNRGQQLVEQADAAMYLAKRAGGQWVAVHDLATGEPRLTGEGAP